MKAGDVKLGAPVIFRGETWAVWSRAHEAGMFWLCRDGEWHPEPVRAADFDSTQRVVDARSAS